jgi:hypothetical protein
MGSMDLDPQWVCGKQGVVVAPLGALDGAV